MLLLRSILFNIVGYSVMAIGCILGCVCLLISRELAFTVIYRSSVCFIWLLKVICKLDYRVENADILSHRPIILASQHQSAWEMFIFVIILKEPTAIIKKELNYIPFFGWLSARLYKNIAIDRKKGRLEAIRSLKNKGKEVLENNGSLVIFPEGTRRLRSGPAKYNKGGISLLYDLGIAQVVPIALNSGDFWGKNGFIKHPGMIVMRCGEPIAPGMDRDEFMQVLVQRIAQAEKEIDNSS